MHLSSAQPMCTCMITSRARGTVATPSPLSTPIIEDIMSRPEQTVGLSKWLTYEPFEGGECSQALISIITASEQAQQDAHHGCCGDQGGSLGPGLG